MGEGEGERGWGEERCVCVCVCVCVCERERERERERESHTTGSPHVDIADHIIKTHLHAHAQDIIHTPCCCSPLVPAR